MTIYRAFPDMSALVSALMTAEFAAVMENATRTTTRLRTGRDRLVAATVHAARTIPNNPVFRRVADVDSELLLPYVVHRLGTTQRAAAAMLRSWIAEGQADGSIRRGDPRLLAHSVLLTTQSFVLSARVVGGPSRTGVVDELRELLDRYLRAGPS